jgi:aerobic C4-dicarboxylate transport protein
MPPHPRPVRRRFFSTLYFRVIVGILLGIAVGLFFPHFAVTLKPFGDGFIKLVRMLVAPIIFFTVVIGIAGIGDTHRLGRVGIRALIYFEAVTTFALAIGYFVAKIVQPGRGMNIDPKSLDVTAVSQYITAGKHLGVVDFLLNIIPTALLEPSPTARSFRSYSSPSLPASLCSRSIRSRASFGSLAPCRISSFALPPSSWS